MNKTILVGIDFSDCSRNALEHALSIAEKAGANLMLIWINKP
ncbi:MAG: universal stress protein, partial [Bacteroidales bacterium]|nr:universal stress protein [Bacteroidales bacterium]